MSAGSASWNFDWTAPSQATATIKVAGNAVNGNNNTSGDQWNLVTFNLVQGTTSVVDVQDISYILYPNPASGQVTIRSKETNDIEVIKAVSLNGAINTLTFQKTSNQEYNINVSSLAAGQYILMVKHQNGTIKHTHMSIK
jgi:hypothetical protein